MDHTMTMARTWLLPADTTAPMAARELLARVLGGHACIDDAALVATELAANAVQHGLPPIALQLQWGASEIEIAVTGTQPVGGSTPAVADAGITAGHGQGMRIVQACARTWDWSVDGRRLTVRATITDG